jgi:RibD C-terminal domain
LKASQRDISVGGAQLAAQAIEGGLVDEYGLFVTPIAVGGGAPALSRDICVKLELLGERRFRGGVVHLHYRPADPVVPAARRPLALEWRQQRSPDAPRIVAERPADELPRGEGHGWASACASARRALGLMIRS